MRELKAIVKVAEPVEILFVADAMTGQDAVRSASAFDAAVPLTGIVLTKLDGDARGGAALSMAKATGKPIRFAGIGEKPEDFELFRPERMVSRILGMGDMLTLIERAEQVVDRKQAEETARKARKGELTLEDFRDQLRQIRKMGSMEKILEMLPGGAAMKAKLPQLDERWTVHMEAIINSMTGQERRNWRLIDASRKRRIATGSGRPLGEVSRLIKSYREAMDQTRTLMSMAQGGGRMPRLPGLPFRTR
jgi:signal recognition particle subunit SRP54